MLERMAGNSTLFDRVGGKPFFEEITRRLYRAVSEDPVLRPLYPPDPDGFEASRLHLELFLAQFWGGPTAYNELRGAPRLRMRHAGFVIGQVQRDAWVEHISEAVRAAGLAPLDEMQLLNYLSAAATHLINRPG